MPRPKRRPLQTVRECLESPDALKTHLGGPVRRRRRGFNRKPTYKRMHNEPNLTDLSPLIDPDKIAYAVLATHLRSLLGDVPVHTVRSRFRVPLKEMHDAFGERVISKDLVIDHTPVGEEADGGADTEPDSEATGEGGSAEDHQLETRYRDLWFDFGDGVVVNAFVNGSAWEFGVSILGRDQGRCEAVHQEILDGLPSPVDPPAKKQNGFFGVVTVDSVTGPETKRIELRKMSVLDEDDLASLYTPEGADWVANTESKLLEKPTGLFLMTGPAGTGKTSLLRHLIGKLDKRVVFYYLPTNQWDLLSRPDFTHYWMDENPRFDGKKAHKVLIVEDADELVRERDAMNMHALSVLLNAADGLLSELLQMSIIATCNTPVGKLDPAVARNGRLLGFRDFRRLDPEEAAVVAGRYDRNIEPATDYSLAEIFAADPGYVEGSATSSIGFDVAV